MSKQSPCGNSPFSLLVCLYMKWHLWNGTPPYKAPVLAAYWMPAPPASPAGALRVGSGVRPHLPTMRWPLKGKASSLISFLFFSSPPRHPSKAVVRGFDLSWVCFSASPLPLSRPFQWGTAVLFSFFFFFYPENVVWSCKCFLAVVLFSLFSSSFFGGLNLPLVTLSAPLWSPRRRLTLSLRKLGQGQTAAWLGTLPSLWSPSYGEIISKF